METHSSVEFKPRCKTDGEKLNGGAPSPCMLSKLAVDIIVSGSTPHNLASFASAHYSSLVARLIITQLD
jgi:hypothetical protein